MIAVVDYRAGNGPSVLNALRKIQAPCKMAKSAGDFDDVSAIILPGVGTADATIESLKEQGVLEAIEQKALRDKIPFLGICVGLQILFEHSEEGDTPCLGWIKGQVRRFEDTVRVPQIGWNRVQYSRPHPLVQGLGDGDYFYFVNSYYVIPEEEGVILGTTEYGRTFCSFVAKENIMASQFHMEKSGEGGLRLLRNFVRIAEGGVELC